MTSDSRRSSPRVKQNLMVRYRPLGDERWHMGTLRDFSVEGACLVCEETYEEGQNLQVELKQPLFDVPAEVLATVRWTRSAFNAGGMMEGLATHGISFGEIKEVLRKYLIHAVAKVIAKENKGSVLPQTQSILLQYLPHQPVIIDDSRGAETAGMVIGVYGGGAKLLSTQRFEPRKGLWLRLSWDSSETVRVIIESVGEINTAGRIFYRSVVRFADAQSATAVFFNASYQESHGRIHAIPHAKVACSQKEGKIAQGAVINFTSCSAELLAAEDFDTSLPVSVGIGKPLFHRPVVFRWKIHSKDILFSARRKLFRYQLDLNDEEQNQRVLSVTMEHFFRYHDAESKR